MQLLRNLIKRCRVTLSYADDKAFPYVQVEFNDKVNDVEVIMPYGLYARIPVDALGHKIIINGDEGDQAAIFSTPSERFKNLAEGEVVVTNGNFKIDSALQIQAKPSMMSPEPVKMPAGHQGHRH